MQSSEVPTMNQPEGAGESKVGVNWRICNTLCIAILALAFFVLCFFRFYFWITHPLVTWADQSVYLEMGKLLWAGKRPYIDFFDFNPPLIMYVNMIPVMVARILHVPATLGLSLTVHTFTFASTVFAAYIAYKARAVTGFMMLVPMFFTFALYTQGLDTDLGQREHIFMLTYLPFLMVRGTHWMGGKVGRVESIVAGLMAGVGLGFKPHFIFAAAATELAFLYQYRKLSCLLRSENFAAAAVVLLYALHFLLLPRESLDILFHQAFPVYNDGVYWSSKCLIHMVRGATYFTKPFANFLIAVGIACLLRNRSPWLTPCAVFTCAGFINYFQGDQAWTYRLLPMAIGSFILYGIEAGILIDWILRRYENFMAPRLLISLGALIAVGSMAYTDIDSTTQELKNAHICDLTELGYPGLSNPRGYLSPLFFSVLANTKPTDLVVHIGSGIEPGHPALLQSERLPGSRYLYSFLVMVEFCQERRGGTFFQNLARKIVDNYGSDIKTRKPELILIQDIPMGAVLEKYNFFDRYMTGYTRLGQTAEHSIYKRIGGQKPFLHSPLARREQLILSILTGARTIDQVSQENHIDRKNLEDWVSRSKKALADALTIRPADKLQEVLEENHRLGEHIADLERQLGDIKLEKERVEAEEVARKAAAEKDADNKDGKDDTENGKKEPGTAAAK